MSPFPRLRRVADPQRKRDRGLSEAALPSRVRTMCAVCCMCAASCRAVPVQVGLRKLLDAEGEVNVMKQELIALQPKLIETGAS